jgi:signal transduction histidine kinase
MDETGESLQLVASHGPLSASAGQREAHYDLGEGLTGWVAQQAQVVRVGDPRTDPRWKGLFMEAPASEIAAVMAVPVLSQRSKPGVLRVVRHRKGSLYFLPQEFTRVDEDVLVTLAGQLGVAIDRTRLMQRLLTSERMAAWGEMSARAAHMIGNTVFGIKGHLNELSYLVKDESKRCSSSTTGEAGLLTENITRGIYRLEEILGEFRDFVLATQLHVVESDLNVLLRAVTAESFPRHSKVDLVLNLAPSLPPIEADEAKLKRAFAELVENSVDFQPHGGTLGIRTLCADQETLRAHARNLAGRKAVQIEVSDSGPGFSEQDRQRAFTPFFTRKAKGMGLGLSIVKGIIEAHGGVIKEVGDTDKPGAHFLVLLPARDAKDGDKM